VTGLLVSLCVPEALSKEFVDEGEESAGVETGRVGGVGTSFGGFKLLSDGLFCARCVCNKLIAFSTSLPDLYEMSAV
jgi:hypothetical protein